MWIQADWNHSCPYVVKPYEVFESNNAVDKNNSHTRKKLSMRRSTCLKNHQYLQSEMGNVKPNIVIFSCENPIYQTTYISKATHIFSLLFLHTFSKILKGIKVSTLFLTKTWCIQSDTIWNCEETMYWKYWYYHIHRHDIMIVGQ